MVGDGLGRGLSDMWRSVVLVVPAALAFVVILLVGWLIARLLRAVVTRASHRAGLDRTAAARYLARGRTTASELCGRLAFYGVLLFALQLAFGVWGPNPVSVLLSDLIAWLPRLLVALVLVIVAAGVARAAADVTEGALGGLSYGRFVARAVSVVIVTVGVVAALDQVGVATAITRPLIVAVLATVAGVLIVGVGGGLIRPMQSRWESWLTRAAAESATVREHVAHRSRADETQVIPPPRHVPSADDTVAVITTAAGDTTIVNPGPNDTIVIGSGTDPERTQVIPSEEK